MSLVQLKWLHRIKESINRGWPLPGDPSFWLISRTTAEAIGETSDEDLKDFVDAGFVNNPQIWELGMCADALKSKAWR